MGPGQADVFGLTAVGQHLTFRVFSFNSALIKKEGLVNTLAIVARLGEHHPMHRKVADSIPVRAQAQVVGSVPGRGVCWRQPIDASLSLSKINKSRKGLACSEPLLLSRMH